MSHRDGREPTSRAAAGASDGAGRRAGSRPPMRRRSHWLRRQRSRRTCLGSTWRPGRCMFALVIAGARRRSAPSTWRARRRSRAARAAVGARLVGELDAVLVEQHAGLRQVGDDRLVRVDEVGVLGRGRAVGRPRPQTRMKPRSRYIAHSSSLTHDLSSARARCSARRSRPGSWSKPRHARAAGAAAARAPRRCAGA